MTNGELFFDRKFDLQAGERKLCLRSARAAMARLRRSRCLDWIFAPIRRYDLMWCLSSYALFLREVAAGRKIRYRKLTEIAVAGASVMGDGEILKLLERNGVDIAGVRWSRGALAPSALACAIANHDDETAKWLWLHGDHAEWQGCSPLRLSLLNWNDDLARWFKSQGVKNTDSTGREYPIPPWV